MSGKKPPEDHQPKKSEQVGRLQGVRNYVDNDDYGYLDITGIFGNDPVAESPYIVTGTFIPEEIGGNVAVVDEDEETLAHENLNQMLNNFLPGGYKQRWGNFDLWRGAWDHRSKTGNANIDPMFTWKSSFPLTKLLGDVDDVAYTELSFDPENVQVYIPLTIKVVSEDKSDPGYVWIPTKEIVWTGDPPAATEPLSSDPTTNYLWFKHVLGPMEVASEQIENADIVDGFGFEDEQEFVRCYYASLLTLYPENSTETKSGLIRYRSESDENTAFVASQEQSQLLTFDLDREELRSKIETTLTANPDLKRDLQFSFLQANVWKHLFFEERELKHTFAVDPLVEHLVGIDYWRRVVDEDEQGVFTIDLSGSGVVSEINRLLPEDSSRHLRLLGHENRAVSEVFETVADNPGPIARLLALSRNDDRLLNFAERVVVHSAEHALSTWSNNLTGSGTSFELWYDVNFQQEDNDYARIAVYDPIQGGAGIAKEVYETLRSKPNLNIEEGLAKQGCCHSATVDRVTIKLLASYPDGSLYEIYERNQDEFERLVEKQLNAQIDYPDAYSRPDLIANVEQQIRTLFETRELASFYSYVAREYTTVEERINRTPRVVDLALHLERHAFTDPSIKRTYERFADDSGRRDIAELGDRLEELTVQCITACPDCLKTEPGHCLHGAGRQESKLNKKLLNAVFDK